MTPSETDRYELQRTARVVLRHDGDADDGGGIGHRLSRRGRVEQACHRLNHHADYEAGLQRLQHRWNGRDLARFRMLHLKADDREHDNEHEHGEQQVHENARQG
ncbi:MAG: hypothetical protein ACLTEX_01405 [Eggerthella lenta]